jgi:hypothetical protein
MCIIYFAAHTGCTHSHLLGAWNCGLNCPNDSRHTFYLDNNGFDCTTCVFLRGEELDPDVNPVEYYAPLFGGEKTRREQKGDGMGYSQDNMYEQGPLSYSEEEQGGNDERVYKALSDPDSLRSKWRATPPTTQHFAYSPAPTSAQASTPYQNNVVAQYPGYSPSKHLEPPVTPHNQYVLSPRMTPRTAAHRDLVRDQLRQLAVAPQTQALAPPPMNQLYPVGLFENPQGDYSLMPQWMARAPHPSPQE